MKESLMVDLKLEMKRITEHINVAQISVWFCVQAVMVLCCLKLYVHVLSLLEHTC